MWAIALLPDFSHAVFTEGLVIHSWRTGKSTIKLAEKPDLKIVFSIIRNGIIS